MHLFDKHLLDLFEKCNTQLVPEVDWAVVFLSPYVTVALLLCASPAAEVTVMPPAADAASKLLAPLTFCSERSRFLTVDLAYLAVLQL